MPPSLSDKISELRRPFTVDEIKAKPQAVSETGKGLVTYYIDARLAAERLDAVVGPENWTDYYRLLADGIGAPSVGIPVECRLTVLGVTKVDVGQIAPGMPDDKAWKSAYSDAFKRAAVKFGVGSYLYGLPTVWAEVKIGKNGKAQGFSDAGFVTLRAAYSKWLAGETGPAAPASLGGGDSERGAGKSQFKAPTEGTTSKATTAQQKQLAELIAATGITEAQISAAAEGKATSELTITEAKDLIARLMTYAENKKKAAA